MIFNDLMNFEKDEARSFNKENIKIQPSYSFLGTGPANLVWINDGNYFVMKHIYSWVQKKNFDFDF